MSWYKGNSPAQVAATVISDLTEHSSDFYDWDMPGYGAKLICALEDAGYRLCRVSNGAIELVDQQARYSRTHIPRKSNRRSSPRGKAKKDKR
jgi:hypothetical protein